MLKTKEEKIRSLESTIGLFLSAPSGNDWYVVAGYQLEMFEITGEGALLGAAMENVNKSVEAVKKLGKDPMHSIRKAEIMIAGGNLTLANEFVIEAKRDGASILQKNKNDRGDETRRFVYSLEKLVSRLEKAVVQQQSKPEFKQETLLEVDMKVKSFFTSANPTLLHEALALLKTTPDDFRASNIYTLLAGHHMRCYVSSH